MARYCDLHSDLQFIALDLSEQLRPGTFEHALNHLIDHQIDWSHFDARYRNDDTGAPAYPPAMLLKSTGTQRLPARGHQVTRYRGL